MASKQFYLLCALLYAVSLSASESLNPTSELSERSAGQHFVMTSKALSGERVIDLYLPQSYHRSQRTYPVIYVMDSDFLFDTTVSIARNRWSRDLMPQAIVVGIRSRNNHERFDFAMPMNRGNGSVAFEHANPDKMARFLQDELTGYLDAHYRTNGYKVLIGMSPTATNVLHDYLNDSANFNAHIAIAADLQFRTLDDVPLHHAIARQAQKRKGGFILVSRASTDLVNDPSREAFFRYLMDLPNAKSLGVHGYLPKDTEHYSVALQSIDYGLSQLFPTAIWRPDYRSLRNSEDPVSYLKTFYENLDNAAGFQTYPTVDGYWMGNSILGLARALGRNDKLPQAAEMLHWADEKLPENPWIQHYLSRVYARMNETNKALNYATLAVSLGKQKLPQDLEVFQQNLKTLNALKQGS